MRRIARTAAMLGMVALLATACAGTGGQPAEETGGGGGNAGPGPAGTPIKIGVVVSITGNASSLGEPERNTVELFKDEFSEIGGYPVQWIVRDDASDPTQSVVQVNRLIAEEGVAAVVCCTTTPSSMAILEPVQQQQVPNISLAAGAQIVTPASERKWVFKTPQNDALMVGVLVDHMVASGIKRVAFLGFNDAYGDGGRKAFREVASQKGIEITAEESFARTDRDVSGQISRMRATNPDAYLIWAIPPGANVAQQNMKDMNITAPIYQSHGVANRNFLELGGTAVEGTLLPAGKLLVAEDLPDSDPQKEILLAYKRRYEERYGEGSANTFGGHAYDAMLILREAIQRAVEAGTNPSDLAAFRSALRDAIEQTRELVGISGIFTYSPEDHHGLDRRAAVMIKVENNDWALAD
ncbi:Extracellular ligand-binding receptor [Thermaerobacter marianensis DSM 12885]|uniref:Extracellular ligand-binding receptor n=1 Tax=Thermaerobacter marianensis (strain ATCC 700841 / DSM 12885 / JCM 10246 / 7p75a) TaxID=644966 RepID=E6SIA4_THEM7|nr:ABC transporter substrate-binding protein [Thermaerobacter marianensis]ADU51915.1 Extracellular ligand-binding receptor [Thermaerobacter marianensis DSM 12885]